jgi:hypothetical protein
MSERSVCKRETEPVSAERVQQRCSKISHGEDWQQCEAVKLGCGNWQSSYQCAAMQLAI